MLIKSKAAIYPSTNVKHRQSAFWEASETIISKMTILDSAEEAFSRIYKACAEGNGPVVVSFVNAHAFNMCLSNPAFYRHIMASDFIFRDGIGVKILFQLLGKKAGINMNGTDFIPFLLEKWPARKLALLGTKKDNLEAAKGHPSLAGHTVVLCEDGFQPVADYIKFIDGAKPEIILLAMGMPKQEEVAALLKQRSADPTLVLNGGAILDFMGGKVPRAPRFVRKIGFEWLFRLCLEPRRLFKRYVIGNVVFLWHSLKIYKATRQ